MKNIIGLAVVAALVLILGGCAQPETQAITMTTPAAPVASPVPEKMTQPEASVPTPPLAPAVVVVTAEPPAAPSVPAPLAAVEAAAAEKSAEVPPAPPAPKQGLQPTPPPATKPAPTKAATAALKPPVATAKPMIFEASMGRVTFDHQKHSTSHPCSSCHATTPPAKFALGKEKAHQLCKGCHQQKGGPVQCTACHKKG